MREILFRGKKESDGKWISGMAWLFSDGSCICPWHKGIGKYDTGYYPVHVIPETVGQYIGIDDKSGQKIFDGDIVIVTSGGVDEEDGPACVVWDEGTARFMLEWRDMVSDFDSFYGHDCEIIGNVYDNPELMEAEK